MPVAYIDADSDMLHIYTLFILVSLIFPYNIVPMYPISYMPGRIDRWPYRAAGIILVAAYIHDSKEPGA